MIGGDAEKGPAAGANIEICPASEDILVALALLLISYFPRGIVSKFFTSPAPAEGLQAYTRGVTWKRRS